MKKFISVFLSVCLILTTLVTGVVTAFAEGNVIEGTNVIWSFNAETKELRFDGEGPIPDYLCEDRAAEYPWKDLGYTTVVIGAGITAIGNYAFCYSNELVSIVIPDTVTVLGDAIFYHCTKLESVTLPADVTTVSADMFSACSLLKDVTIGANTKTIERNAFYNCYALESITLPSTLETIEEAAFYGSGLKSVDIPEGVTTLGPRVFYSCLDLADVTLPSTLTSVGNNLFDACMALTSIAFPDSITSLPAAVCSNCRELTSVTLPANLVSIGDGAFEYCLKLTEITVPASTVEIGTKALGYGRLGYLVAGFKIKGYENSKVVLYAAANNIVFESLGYVTSGTCGESATWEYVADEKTLYINGTGATYNYTADDFVAYNRIPYEAVVIGDGITKLGSYAFYNAGAMKFSVLANIVEIGEKAIGYYNNNGTPALRDGTVIECYDNTPAKTYADENSIPTESLGNYLFTEGSLGESIMWYYDTEAKKLTVVGTGATYDYTQENLPDFADYDIQSVLVSHRITALGDFSLYTNTPYNEITLGKDITKIGKYAFGFVENVVTDEEETLPEEDTTPEEGTIPVEDTLPEEGTTPEEGEGDGMGDAPDAEVPAFVANEELVIKGYLVTPADEFAEYYGFTFIALDGNELPFFSFVVTSLVDHINQFIVIYQKTTNAEQIMENFPADDFIEVTAPETFATGAEFKLVNENGEYTYKVVVMGDTTGDGKVNSSDALVILQHAVGQNVIEDDAFKTASNLNFDNRINSTDALVVLQVSVGMTDIENIYNPGFVR